MKKLIAVVVGMVMLASVALADWKPEQVAQFEAWSKLAPVSRYSGVKSAEVAALLHPKNMPSIAECDRVIAIAEQDAKDGVSGSGGILLAAQRARTYNLVVAAGKIVTADASTLKDGETALAEAQVYAIKVKMLPTWQNASLSFYHGAWLKGHYKQQEREAQYLMLCGYAATDINALFMTNAVPKTLQNDVVMRAGASVAAKARAKFADLLMDKGIIRLVVEANALGETSNAEVVALLGEIVKQSWTRVQLDFPDDEKCSAEQLKAKTALRDAANKVASIREGLLAAE